MRGNRDFANKTAEVGQISNPGKQQNKERGNARGNPDAFLTQQGIPFDTNRRYVIDDFQQITKSDANGPK